MVVCSVPGCAGKGTRMFHSFPKNADVRQIWIKNTRTSHLSEKQLNSYGKICKYHFRESDFETNPRGQQGLKKNAVPSINLPKDSPLENYLNFALDSDDTFVPRKRQQKQQATEANPLADSKNHDLIMDLGIDVHEVVLVDESQYIPVNVAKIKEYEKVAEDCKMYEEKIKDFERILREMERKEKQNHLALSKLLKKDQLNQKKIKNLRQELKDEKSKKRSKIMKKKTAKRNLTEDDITPKKRVCHSSFTNTVRRAIKRCERFSFYQSNGHWDVLVQNWSLMLESIPNCLLT